MKRAIANLILFVSIISFDSSVAYANEPAKSATDAAIEAIDAANAATDAANLAAEAADVATVAAEEARDIQDEATVIIEGIKNGLRDKTTPMEDRALATLYSNKVPVFNSNSVGFRQRFLVVKEKYDLYAGKSGIWERVATSYLRAATSFERAQLSSESAAKNSQLIFETLTKIANEKELGKFTPKSPIPTPTPSKSPTQSPEPSKTTTPRPNSSDPEDEEEFEGEEFDEPEIAAKVQPISGKWRISITSNIDQDVIEIQAKKKGSKSYRFEVTTKSTGSATFTTTRKLAGYTLFFYYYGELVTSITTGK
jgi:hypothetical protein